MTTHNKRKNKKRMKKELTNMLVKELGVDTRKIKIQLVELDNKSRKGKYIYIKVPRQKARYYKKQEGVSVDNYIKAYEGKIRVKKKGVVEYKGKKPADVYVEKVKSRPRIDSLISKGISENAEIGDLKNADRATVRKAYKDMLRPLVKDEKLLDILALEENVEKFKYRIQTKITIVGLDGKIKLTFSGFNKSIDNIFNDFGKIINKKNVYNEDLKKLKEMGYALTEIEGTDIKSTYESQSVMPTVAKIKLNLRYVKGK